MCSKECCRKGCIVIIAVHLLLKFQKTYINICITLLHAYIDMCISFMFNKIVYMIKLYKILRWTYWRSCPLELLPPFAACAWFAGSVIWSAEKEFAEINANVGIRLYTKSKSENALVTLRLTCIGTKVKLHLKSVLLHESIYSSEKYYIIIQ